MPATAYSSRQASPLRVSMPPVPISPTIFRAGTSTPLQNQPAASGRRRSGPSRSKAARNEIKRSSTLPSITRSSISRSVADVDGTYHAPDGTVAHVDGWTPRTCFSGWDVFRAEFPLLCMIEPGVVSDQINTLMQINESGVSKGLPRWELMGRDTPIMLGDPALSVISEAYLKGIRGFDVDKAYAMCWGVG